MRGGVDGEAEGAMVMIGNESAGTVRVSWWDCVRCGHRGIGMCKGHACGLETEIAKRGAAAGAHDRAFPALLHSGGTPLGPLCVGVGSGVAAPVVWGHSAVPTSLSQERTPEWEKQCHT